MPKMNEIEPMMEKGAMKPKFRLEVFRYGSIHSATPEFRKRDKRIFERLKEQSRV